MHRLCAIDTIPHFVNDMDICDKINIKRDFIAYASFGGELDWNTMVWSTVENTWRGNMFFSPFFGVGLARVKDGHN